MGLLDYPEVVLNPMDLGAVRQRLEAGQYATQEEALRDVRLVWSNCKLYNRDGSEVTMMVYAYLLSEAW